MILDNLLQLRDPATPNARTCFCDPNCEELRVSVDSILVLANNEDLLGSTGGIVNYKTYPMIRYRRRIMFSIEDLLGNIRKHVNRECKFELLLIQCPLEAPLAF